MLWSRATAMLGQLEELERCDPWIREAVQCEDMLRATRLRLISIPYYLLQDDLERANKALEIPERLVGPPADLTSLLHVQGEVAVALYRGDAHSARDLVDSGRTIDSSPLFTVRLCRSDYLVTRARLLLLGSQCAEDAEAQLQEVVSRTESIDNYGLESHTDHARILRAGVEYRRGDTTAALHELNTILSDADMGGDSRIIRACARMRKGQILGGDEGELMVRESMRELSARGAKAPERFARLYSPGFEAPIPQLKVVGSE
jgi:hypothetical protein